MRSLDRGVTAVSALLIIGCAGRQQPEMTVAPSSAGSGRLTVEPVWRSPAGAPVAASAAAVAMPAAPSPRERVLASADGVVGTRYRYGGSTPEHGFDCSGLVQWIFARQGVELPRTARAMSAAGIRVPARRTVLAPGDLLFFAEGGGRVSHVAIYVGDGRIVHASSGLGAVRYDDLDSPRGQWFRRHVVSARRVLVTE